LAHRPIISLTTDFGLNDHFVGTVKGVILNIAPDAEIVDISHAVERFDILDGALTLFQAYSYFPADTIHLIVVDPGVGTSRRPIVATTERHHFVAPDNGVLSLLYARENRLRVFHANAEHYYLQPVSRTFHARDVFAPIAAHLAKGVVPAKLGEEITDFVRLKLPEPKVIDQHTLQGTVLRVDRFGNLFTNLTAQHAAPLFQADPPPFKIVVGGQEIGSLKNTYGESAPGEVFSIIGSGGYLEIAVNQGSAAQTLQVSRGGSVDLIFETAIFPGQN
jgi:S-adenosyl-L-methionine hydrolase (adenosine-forming)